MKTHLLLFATLLITVISQAQMVLEYEIPEAGDSIALPLNGTVDVTVDWGDGLQEDFTTAEDQWHIYVTEGTKTVTITGTLTHFGSSSIEKENNLLTKVISWNNLGLDDLSFAFFNATKLVEVPNYLPPAVTSLGSTFQYAFSFNDEKISEWNTSNVTTMRATFLEASSFNQDLSNWNTSNVTTMKSLFLGATSFNQAIDSWNTEKVTDMSDLFYRASNFNQNIENWNTSNVTDMSFMFHSAHLFNQNISTWNTGNVTDMSDMFNTAKSFNQPIGNWNTSNVTDMGGMFWQAESFNQSLENWNTEKVTSMSYMFYKAGSFNQNINNWNTSSVTRIERMFSYASMFNKPLDQWNTENVTNMREMFSFTANFNQDINSWNTSKVTDMKSMFNSAKAFNQSLDNWDVSSITDMTHFLVNTGLCTENYDATLNSWATQAIQDGVTLDAWDSKYSEAGAEARVILAEKWTITDGGLGLTEDDKCSPVLNTGDLSTSSSLEAYPNPVQDKLQIEATSLLHYAIYSLTGNLVEEASVQSSNIEIDLNELPSGIYILQTEYQEKTQSQRFTKL